MSAAPEAGPGLANPPRMHTLDLRLKAAARPRVLRYLPAAIAVLSILFLAGLALAGYPVWRIAAVGALLASVIFRVLPFNPALRRGGRPVASPLVTTATHVLIAALTGGLRSPFLVMIIGPFSGALLTYGWTRASKSALASIIAGAVAMTALPARWFGPPVAEPAFSLLTALTLIAVVSLNSGFFVSMIRAMKEIHCEIDRAREQMAASALARARELEQMSAQLSHELKNPLGAIKTLVQLSARDACDDKSRERLEVAEAEVERMNCILKEYLSFSRPLDKLRREPLALGALGDEVIALLEPQAASAGVALRRRGDARVEADPRRLKEALFNLVANALEATPRGGSVEMEIAENSGAVRVSVRDSGTGMRPEILERLGTPFFTTREQGTGLGVLLARAAFVQHGGTLEYASVEGRGTTATATLPARPQERRSDGAPAPG